MAKALHRQVGQLVVAGFAGYSVPAELRALAREWDLGGVVLFARNIEAPEQVAELTFELQELAQDIPLWVCVDQEGGRVARLRAPFTEWPAMTGLGRRGESGLARRFATALADELSAVGVTLDFAPVLDLYDESADPVIGDRALSSDPATVSRLGRVIIEGFQNNGIAACAKHFPGHGAAGVDSHRELPVIEHSPERLREKEMAPFRAAIAGEVAAVMTAHVLYPALDEEHPASLSQTVVDEILRRELGHRGLVVTDDLDMGAITESQTVEQAAARELKEETGCECDGIFLVGQFEEEISGSPHTAHVVTCVTHDVPKPDRREVVEARFFPTHSLPEPLSPHTSARLRFFQDPKNMVRGA